MSALPLGMTGAQSMMVVVEGVRALAGRQVLGLEEAWTALTGYSAEDLDSEERRAVLWLLEELGYERQWVVELGGYGMKHLWVRGPWPLDHRANRDRSLVKYVSMS